MLPKQQKGKLLRASLLSLCGLLGSEAPGGGLFGEDGSYIWQLLSQSVCVDATGRDGLPGDLGVGGDEGINASLGHVYLDGIFEGLDLSVELVSHEAQFLSSREMVFSSLVDMG